MAIVDPPRQVRRYPIAVLLRYREDGASKWHVGETVNVSHTGILFRVGGAPPTLSKHLHIELALPLGGRAPVVRVRCTGHVVRARPSGFLGGGYEVAVAIEGYALERRLAG